VSRAATWAASPSISRAISRDLKELIRDATALPQSDRASLAGVLIESPDPKLTPEVAAAWSREIERRVRELDDGSVELVDWESFARSKR